MCIRDRSDRFQLLPLSAASRHLLLLLLVFHRALVLVPPSLLPTRQTPPVFFLPMTYTIICSQMTLSRTATVQSMTFQTSSFASRIAFRTLLDPTPLTDCSLTLPSLNLFGLVPVVHSPRYQQSTTHSTSPAPLSNPLNLFVIWVSFWTVSCK